MTDAHRLPPLDVLATSDLEASIAASRCLVASLYDVKGIYKDAHQDLSDLRVKLVNNDTPLHKIPPSEPSFLQHVKRACFQT